MRLPWCIDRASAYYFHVIYTPCLSLHIEELELPRHPEELELPRHPEELELPRHPEGLEFPRHPEELATRDLLALAESLSRIFDMICSSSFIQLFDHHQMIFKCFLYQLNTCRLLEIHRRKLLWM